MKDVKGLGVWCIERHSVFPHVSIKYTLLSVWWILNLCGRQRTGWQLTGLKTPVGKKDTGCRNSKLLLSYPPRMCPGITTCCLRRVPCVLRVCSVICHARLFATPWAVAHQAPLSMGFSPVRILEWVAMPSARESSQAKDWTRVSHVSGFTGRFFATEPLGRPHHLFWDVYAKDE